MQSITLGLTYDNPCSYIAQQQRLAFVLPATPLSPELYQQLIDANFRRSHQQVYRPHCSACDACQSVRLNPRLLTLSTSQRRLAKKALNAAWRFQLVDTPSQPYFGLYQAYIAFKHRDSSMYPASETDLNSMLECSWLAVHFLEQYLNDQLVSVTVVDVLPDGLSAVYTFYCPTVSPFSPGKLAILNLAQITQQLDKSWLYLGYSIDNCEKMAYKANFKPQQRFIQGHWHSFG
ncbi:arginyltransferase [Rheinheimera salexigens]|uniref:Arginyltransferase n=1 Tax=Rheinheimera salexigens TaxID=1628148 RepID=A0A1E7Q5Y1_9GAMM|nr:arginyltransferase [Rheinheimera salexigens]OEY69478.1 arginyltransferase [Rheinheimera salexigens]